MPSISYETFAAEVLALYAPPLSAKATCAKMAQVLREFGELAKSTEDLTPQLVARWLTGPHCSGRAAITNRTLLSTFRAACNIGVFQRYLARSPTQARKAWIRVRRTPEKPHLTREEIARLLDLLKKEATDWTGQRLYA